MALNVGIGSQLKNDFRSSTSSSSANPKTYVGGIIGDGAADNCYNMGNIQTVVHSDEDTGENTYVGGISGNGNASKCYNIGNLNVSGAPSSHIGGISGNYFSAINPRSYALNLYGSDYGTQLTSEQMKEKANFFLFDFDTVWDIDPAVNNGYPFLRNLAVNSGGDTQTKIEFEYPSYTLPVNGGTVIYAFISNVDFEVDYTTMTCFVSDPAAITIQETYNKLSNGNYKAALTLTAKKQGTYTITLQTKKCS